MIMSQESFRKFSVQIQFRDLVLGGRPMTQQLLEAWLKERDIKISSGRDLQCLTRGDLKSIESSDIKASAWNTFESDNEGLFIEERNVKGMLRDAGMVSKIGKSSVFPDIVRNGIFTKPERIHLKRSGSTVKRPDGYIDRVALPKIRCKTRGVLKRQDFVKQPSIDFQLWVVAGALSDEEVQSLFLVGQEVGLGASRTQGYGKFDAHVQQLFETCLDPESRSKTASINAASSR
jgi:hypothetical protein